MAEPSWTDWTTAISTAFTGLFAAIAASVSVLAYRRDAKRAFPRIELEVIEYGRAEFGPFAKVRLIVWNRLDETLEVKKISVAKPKGARISRGQLASSTQPWKQKEEAALGLSNSIEPNYRLRSEGAASTVSGIRFDRLTEYLYFVPPHGWSSGPIEFEVFISSNADTIRHKRMVVKSAAALPIAQKTEATANSSG